MLPILVAHHILTVDVGTRRIFRSSATYKEVYKYLKKKVGMETAIQYYEGDYY